MKREERYPSGTYRPITHGAYLEFKQKKELAKLFRILFAFFFSMIIIFTILSCRIYYYCISPDCLSFWGSIMGIGIKLGGMK
jgi:hypothetical protein